MELPGWRVWWFNVLSRFISCWYNIYIYTVFIYLYIYISIYIPPYTCDSRLWVVLVLELQRFPIAKVWNGKPRASWLETYRNVLGACCILGAQGDVIMMWGWQHLLLKPWNWWNVPTESHWLFSTKIMPMNFRQRDHRWYLFFKSLGSVVGFRYVGVFFPNTIPRARIWTSFLALLLGCVQCTKGWSDPEQYQWSLARG